MDEEKKTVVAQPVVQKKTARGLVAVTFKRAEQSAGEVMREVNALTPADLVQLGSAIARELGLADDALAFAPVQY